MRAVVYESNEKPLVLQDVPAPTPGPGQLVLEVDSCGICGSDLHAYQVNLYPAGMTPGHEYSGRVVAVGEGLADQWQVGDRAVALGAILCRECPACLSGDFAACEQLGLTGFFAPGAYAEQVLASAELTVRIPEDMPLSQAALVEPLTIGLTAIRDAQVPMGGSVLVLGAGIIGLATAKWARFFGANEIVVSDLDPERLQRAREHGATAVIDASVESDPVAAFRRATGIEPDVIIECVGRPMLKHLVEVAPNSCHIVSVGVSMNDEPLCPQAASMKKLQMTFSFGAELEDFRFAIKMMHDGRMPTEGLITACVSLDEVPRIFAELMEPNGHCKVMIDVQAGSN